MRHISTAPPGVTALPAAAMRTDIIPATHNGSVEDAVSGVCREMLATGGEHVILLTGTGTEVDVEKLTTDLGVDVLAFPADGLGHLVEIGVE